MSNESKAEYDYYCPNCEEEVDKDTAECNLCGYPIAEHGGTKEVKKPIKIPELPYQALSTRGKVWYLIAGKFYKHLSFKQKFLYHVVLFIMSMITFIGIKIYINYDSIAPYLDDDVYWVEKLNGEVEFLTIPDGCGPIIEKLAQDEEVTDSEITKLRNTVPIEDASLLYSALRRTWYTENGYIESLLVDMLILTDIYNFETRVYGSTEHDILD